MTTRIPTLRTLHWKSPIWWLWLVAAIFLAMQHHALAAGRRSLHKRVPRCARRDLMIPLKYVDGGRVWIPRQAACGGTFPVIVLLHGNNPLGRMNKYLGGGKRIELLARQYLGGRFIEPVILAQPIHHGVARRNGRRNGVDLLWGGNFDFKVYRRLLTQLLRRHHIRPKNWSFIGHSGAGCATAAGLFAAARVWKNIKVWATADTCYGSTTYAEVPRKRFSGTSTILYNACRGTVAYAGYPRYARELFGSRPKHTPCDLTYYKRCIRHPKRPWYSFVTRPKTVKGHGPVVTELIKTILWRHYPSRRRILAAAGKRGGHPRHRRRRRRLGPRKPTAPQRRVATGKTIRARRRRLPPGSGPVIRIKPPPQLVSRD